MENQVFVMDHPLIQHKLTFLRSKDTGSKEFRELVSEIGMLMCYEATRDLPLENARIEPPIGPATTKVIAGRKMAFIPILRAGLGMVDGVLALVPAAKVGHIGLYRDPKTLKPVEYYSKLPSDITERDVIVLDPPRDGIQPKALPKILDYGVDKIVYISCKVTSLARDLEMIQARGYEVVKSVAVDQFCQTVHVETMVLLQRKNM